jgi:hypothetical protein
MHVDGSCHCGHIRFEAEIVPEHAVACHCTDCQTFSSSAFRVVVPTRPGTFRLLAGQPRIYVKTAESGNKREQTFCPECGTPIYSAPPGPEPRSIGLRVGALRQRAQIAPRERWWHRSAPAWLGDLPAVPAQESQPTLPATSGATRE